MNHLRNMDLSNLVLIFEIDSFSDGSLYFLMAWSNHRLIHLRTFSVVRIYPFLWSYARKENSHLDYCFIALLDVEAGLDISNLSQGLGIDRWCCLMVLKILPQDSAFKALLLLYFLCFLLPQLLLFSLQVFEICGLLQFFLFYLLAPGAAMSTIDKQLCLALYPWLLHKASDIYIDSCYF